MQPDQQILYGPEQQKDQGEQPINIKLPGVNKNIAGIKRAIAGSDGSRAGEKEGDDLRVNTREKSSLRRTKQALILFL